LSSEAGASGSHLQAAFNANNKYSLDALPLELLPARKDQPFIVLNTAISKLSSNGTIRNLLTNHGAIHFKDLGLQTAEEFSRFAQSFGWTPHEDIGNPVRRTVHAFNVATANEGLNTQPVYPHNEFGLSSHYPAYIFLYCLSAPETGL
jgi:alpha-ketoglutarate-dependent taurine dioxygenase